jgi:hypothetical protein
MRDNRALDRALTGLAVAYFAAVTVGVVARYERRTLASSPDDLAGGEAWRLLTSALTVQGRLPLAQVAMAALVAFVVVRALGALAWWGAALSAHVGSALVAYAFIGIADVLGDEGAEQVGDDLDYGVSVVLAGSLGALFATSLRHGRRGVAAVCALALVAFIPLSLSWYGIEHPLGFAFGAAFTAWWERRDGG